MPRLSVQTGPHSMSAKWIVDYHISSVHSSVSVRYQWPLSLFSQWWEEAELVWLVAGAMTCPFSNLYLVIEQRHNLPKSFFFFYYSWSIYVGLNKRTNRNSHNICQCTSVNTCHETTYEKNKVMLFGICIINYLGLFSTTYRAPSLKLECTCLFKNWD